MDDLDRISQIMDLARIQCSIEEVAAELGMSRLEMYAFFDENPDISKIYDESRVKGTARIKELQFKIAEAGNVTMAMWLGKQYLGQREQTAQEVKVEVTEGEGVRELLTRLDGMAERIGAGAAAAAKRTVN